LASIGFRDRGVLKQFQSAIRAIGRIGHDEPVRTFDQLIAEAAVADVSGWGFGWLQGRATEERPPWSYSHLLAERLRQVASALDIDTGGGEVVAAEAPKLPPRMVVTESWPLNAERARTLLSPRGVDVVASPAGGPLAVPDQAFELVTSRHPIRPMWHEIYRVLEPGGRYLAQHVGPDSAAELIGQFDDTPSVVPSRRDPQLETAAAEQAGLTVIDLRPARCRMEFYDVGAIVWILRKCVWWVPGFTPENYYDDLARLDTQMRGGVPFVAHSTRHLIEAARPT
jgi:SAM-dependent methyltransferase